MRDAKLVLGLTPMNIAVVPPDEFGPACASAFLEAIAQFPAPVVGLPTGQTPLAMYAELQRLATAGKASVAAVRPYAIDEYVGQITHPASNRSYFARYWSTIPGAAKVVGFDPDARFPDAECAWYTAMIEADGGLDVVVLGIGANGHLAFNEPGSERDSRARRVPLAAATRDAAYATWSKDTPEYGLTLGIADILAARRVLLLANGAAKAAIVARALHGPITPDCPATFLQHHPHLTVILDTEAAATPSSSPPAPHDLQ